MADYPCPVNVGDRVVYYGKEYTVLATEWDRSPYCEPHWRATLDGREGDVSVAFLCKVESGARWRVGRKLGRTIYRDDECVGMVDTPEIAAAIVAAMNGATRG